MIRIAVRHWLLVLLLISLPAKGQTPPGHLPLLWMATSKTSTVYLYGTIHVGTQDFYPLHSSVEEALSRSSIVALEADPTNQTDVAAALARAGYRPPDRLDNHISAGLAAELRVMLPRLGLPVDAARRMKPYLLSMALSMSELGKMGYEAQYGLDIHFAQRAQRDGKKLVALESLQAQMDLFDALPDDMQEALLRATLSAIGTGELRRNLTDLIAAWRAGDAPRLVEVMDRDMRSLPQLSRDRFKHTFFDARNEAMAARIADFLQNGQQVHFVAVGAGHLPGETGIVALLQGMGFSVSRVP